MCPAYAQDAGSLLRQQQRNEELRRLDRLPEQEPVRPVSPGGIGPEKGETIVLKALRFTGRVGILPEADRVRISASARGKRLGLSGIKALADEVTIAIQASGRLLGYATLPPQDITDGTVTIRIIEGALEKSDIHRQPGVRAREDRLAGIARSHVRDDGPQKADLEEALLRMNDWPGVTARARLSPGSVPHASRLTIDVDQAPILSGSLWGNNFGDPSTGRAQANAQLTITDLSGTGDLTRLSGVASQGQTFGQAAFSLPLDTSPLTFNANYAHLDYHNIDKIGSALGLKGSADFAGFGLDYSLVRSRTFDLRLSGSLGWKALADDSIVGRLQDKRSLSGSFAINGDLRDAVFGGGLTSWSLGWTIGDLDLSRLESAVAADQAGLRTQGQFQRFNVQVARLQKLPGDFSLFGRFYGQSANRNLDSSEDFALGGPYGVRGFAVGDGRGDVGVIATLELRYDAPVPAEWGQVQLATFLDTGHIWVNVQPNGIPTANVCGCNDYTLASAGLSARWTRKNLSFSASWAHALADNPGRSNVAGGKADGIARSQQVWLQGAISF